MIPTQPFGSTGHRSTRVVFGAAALGGMSEERAASTLQIMADAGVNHIDTAAGYGESELRLRPWLAAHRQEVFLATKTGERTGSGARAGLEQSLQRMGVDQVDLIQLHNLVEEEEWATAFSAEGAVAALVKAREEGLCRFIGVTGHGTRIPAMHLRSLERHPFDSVLFPYNHVMLTNTQYQQDVEALLAVCDEQGVAVQTIKSVARRRWPENAERRFSWYEPIDDPAAHRRAVHFVLSRPSLFLNTSSDARLLPATLAAASETIVAPTHGAMEADRVGQGITPLFDGAELERI